MTPLAASYLASIYVTGVKGLQVLKTTQSGYEGFLHDKYTMLPDVRDRIMATSITSTWRCVCPPLSLRRPTSLPPSPLRNVCLFFGVSDTFASSPPPHMGLLCAVYMTSVMV